MNKKQLMQKLGELVDTVNSLNRQMNLLQKENEELKTEIEILKARPASEAEEAQLQEDNTGFTINTNLDAPVPPPAETVEEKVIEPETSVPTPKSVILPDISMEYGSHMIGKIVVEAARYAERISASSAENKKELLNLIMGKAEVAKAEVFAVVSSSADEEIKKELCEAHFNEALDYFKSVAGQI